MKKNKRKKSIFSRLVKSYVIFLVLSIILYFVVAIVFLIKMGNGDVGNMSPQSIVQDDGSIKDLNVLEKNGGWVEELDNEGNVINIYGNQQTNKASYTISELANLLDLGYIDYDNYGVIIKNPKEQTKKSYSACVRCVGNPEKVFLVCYPSDMVDYKITFQLTDGNGGSAGSFILVLAALFLTEVLLISLYLKRHIDKPIKQLMSGMDEVSNGERDVVLDYNTDKEFEDIRDKFNRMARKLKESEEEKHQIEQRRNQMLLELAHDIKNPVASIKSSVTALNEGLVSDDKLKDYYRTIDMKAERIRTLTEDMNTSLKLESDSYELVREEKDVCEIVRRICVEFYEDITATGKDFDINIPEEPCMASVDEKLFGRVINNLLANANKYNSSGKLIVLNLSSENSEILIEVMDDGEAIDEEFVPKMFDEFARGDKTRKTDGGTGLGLAISRKIMEKHNGSLKYIRAEGMNCFCARLNAQT